MKITRNLTPTELEKLRDLYWEDTFEDSEAVDIHNGRLNIESNDATGDLHVSITITADNDTDQAGNPILHESNGSIQVSHELFYSTNDYIFDPNRSNQKLTRQGDPRRSPGLWNYAKEVLEEKLTSQVLENALGNLVKDEILPAMVISPIPPKTLLVEGAEAEITPLFSKRGKFTAYASLNNGAQRRRVTGVNELPDRNNLARIKFTPDVVGAGEIQIEGENGERLATYKIEVQSRLVSPRNGEAFTVETGKEFPIPVEIRAKSTEKFTLTVYQLDPTDLTKRTQIISQDHSPDEAGKISFVFRSETPGPFEFEIRDEKGKILRTNKIGVTLSREEVERQVREAIAAKDDGRLDYLIGLQEKLMKDADQEKRWNYFVNMIPQVAWKNWRQKVVVTYNSFEERKFTIDIVHPNAGTKPSALDEKTHQFLQWLGNTISAGRLAVAPAHIAIESHTDITGSDSTNQKISADRARLAKEDLQAGFKDFNDSGLPNDLFELKALGEAETNRERQPLAWKRNPERKRTEISFSFPSTTEVMIENPLFPQKPAAAPAQETKPDPAPAPAPPPAPAPAPPPAEVDDTPPAAKAPPILNKEQIRISDNERWELSQTPTVRDPKIRLTRYRSAQTALAPLPDLEDVPELKRLAAEGIQEAESAIAAAEARKAEAAEKKRIARQVTTLVSQAKDKLSAAKRAKKEAKIAAYQVALEKLDEILALQSDHPWATQKKTEVNEIIQSLTAEPAPAEPAPPEPPPAPEPTPSRPPLGPPPIIENATVVSTSPEVRIQLGKVNKAIDTVVAIIGDVEVTFRNIAAGENIVLGCGKASDLEVGPKWTGRIRIKVGPETFETDKDVTVNGKTPAARAVDAAEEGAAPASTELTDPEKRSLREGNTQWGYYTMGKRMQAQGQSVSNETLEGYLKKTLSFYSPIPPEKRGNPVEMGSDVTIAARMAEVERLLREFEASRPELKGPADGTKLTTVAVGSGGFVDVGLTKAGDLTAQYQINGGAAILCRHSAGDANATRHRFAWDNPEAGTVTITVIRSSDGKRLATYTQQVIANRGAGTAPGAGKPSPYDQWQAMPNSSDPVRKAAAYQASEYWRSTIKMANARAGKRAGGEMQGKIQVEFDVNNDGTISDINPSCTFPDSDVCAIYTTTLMNLVSKMKFNPHETRVSVGTREDPEATKLVPVPIRLFENHNIIPDD